ncbi:ABC transporter ATP-binding protein [Myxococcota bacterium]|nr:ABC transporter ATP-binding protein [Myxococcota bacterium]MBU1382332.1 ABC transporter ATP-binding protein [Myxococcota bacterium]MBU1498436.1 ABC transporter ATP-binding protein [Myxococcota bacterium]
MIEFKDVFKIYDKRKVLDGMSLKINEGEIFGFLGPNGAGKSTSVSIACGLKKPSSGSVTIGNGLNPESSSARKILGLVPQSIALYPDLTASENLSFFASIYGLSGAKLKNRVEWALEAADLVEHKNRRAGVFSGGMQRRLNIACALMHDPQIIIMDEPTVGVDPQSRNRIFETVKDLRSKGKTVIYVTHYMEEAEKLCDRIGIIDMGKILAVDTTQGLIASHKLSPVVEVSFGETTTVYETDNPLKELEKLQKTGGMTSFNVRQPSLEDVFLKMTGHKLRD